MARLTQRVSALLTTVTCPRCGTVVDPNTIVTEDASPGERRSYLWVAPRGDFCPNCDFPLSKYFGRIQWIRTMAAGVVLVLVGFVCELVGAMIRFPEWYYFVMRNVIRLGAILTAIGALGVLIGKKHTGVRALDQTPRGKPLKK
jgi:hypothetical protein